MEHKIKVLIDEATIDKRVREIAAQISLEYGDEPVLLLCILKGSAFFSCELAKRITSPVLMDYMSVSSYGSGTVSSGKVRIIKDMDEDIVDKNVIIVEDIVDSGRTLAYLKKMLESRGPKSLKICTLLDKPERREVTVDVDYNGFEVPDLFVVGYGLDYDQRYRNLPYIGEVEFE